MLYDKSNRTAKKIGLIREVRRFLARIHLMNLLEIIKNE